MFIKVLMFSLFSLPAFRASSSSWEVTSPVETLEMPIPTFSDNDQGNQTPLKNKDPI